MGPKTLILQRLGRPAARSPDKDPVVSRREPIRGDFMDSMSQQTAPNRHPTTTPLGRKASRGGALALLLPLMASLSLSTAAGAQSSEEDRTFNLERFRPALDRYGILDVESGQVRGHLDFDLGLVVNYSLNPLLIREEGERVGALVAHRVGGNLTGNIGLLDFLSLGVDLPLIIFQAADVDGSKSAVADLAGGDLSAIAVGDLRLQPKVQLVKRDWGFVDVALMPTLTLPTNFPKGAFGGDGFLTFSPEVAVSKPLLANDRLRLAANLGYRLRPDADLGDLSVGQEFFYRAGVGYGLHDIAKVPVEVDLTVSGAAATLRQVGGVSQNPLEALLGATWDVYGPLQVFAAVGAGLVGGFGTPDFRALGGVRFSPPPILDRDGDGVDDDVDACVDDPEDKDGFEDTDGCPDPDNDGDGIADAADTCPNEAEDADGFEDADGCPDTDNDKDGIADAADKCRDDAEDKDGFEDEDGCPDPDNDGDGIADTADKCPLVAGVAAEQGCPRPDTDGDGVFDDEDQCPKDAGPRAQKGCPDSDGDGLADNVDKCPNEPEIINGFEDEDGCPDKGKSKVVITREKIEILEKVFFDVGKAKIQKRSFGLLDQVAAVLKNNPQLSKIRIEGHTDSDGSDRSNLDLSQRRTDSVQLYLMDKGVDAARLEAVGYGESRPAVPNSNKVNKEMNRRVEFAIVELDGKPIKATESVPAPAGG